jgi:hypothetical protein
VPGESTAHENQFTAIVDARGYVVGGYCNRVKPEGLGFLDYIRAMRDAYPLDPADIVYEPGQQFDTDGRPLTVVEMEHLTLTEKKAA